MKGNRKVQDEFDIFEIFEYVRLNYIYVKGKGFS